MYKAIDKKSIKIETITLIGQFTVLWGMVEDNYFDKCCNNTKLSKMIVSDCIDGMIEFAESIKKELLYFYNDEETVLKSLCFRNKDNKTFAEIVEAFLKHEEYSPEDAIRAAVCLCFRIRNNMFHGEKVFWLLNNQAAIIEACAAFLNELLMNNNVIQIG